MEQSVSDCAESRSAVLRAPSWSHLEGDTPAPSPDMLEYRMRPHRWPAEEPGRLRDTSLAERMCHQPERKRLGFSVRCVRRSRTPAKPACNPSPILRSGPQVDERSDYWALWPARFPRPGALLRFGVRRTPEWPIPTERVHDWNQFQWTFAASDTHPANGAVSDP